MNKIISMDWLSFSYFLYLDENERLNVSTNLKLNVIPGYSYEYLKGTAIFNNRVIVRDVHGIKKITLLYGPKSPVISSGLMLCEIANNCFYSTEFMKIIYLVTEIHAGTFNNISRVDVCCDFDLIGDKIASDFLNDVIYVQRKTEGASFFNYVENKDGKIIKEPKQLNWGSKTSKIKWKLYNKSLEIKESKKDYIKQLWKDENLNYKNGNIWRLEFSLNRCASLQMLDEKGTNLLSVPSFSNFKSYIKVFENFYKNRFITCYNDGYAHDKNKKDRYFDFLEIIGNNYEVTLKETDRTKNANLEIYNYLNSLIINFQKSSILFNFILASQTLDLIISVCNEFYLYDYIAEKYGFTIEKLQNILNNPNLLKETQYGKF